MEIEKTENQPTPAEKRPPSNYNRYFSDHLRQKKHKDNPQEFAVITYEHPAYVRPQ